MLYNGRDETNKQHDPIVFNDFQPVKCSKVDKGIFIFLCIITLGLFYLIGNVTTKNKLNNMEMKINESASGVDIQLTKRFDTLNKLVNAVKSHTQFNKDVYENIAMYRSKFNINGQTNPNELMEKDALIGNISRGINVAFENYPQLGADESIRDLRTQIIMIEREIASARRLYNTNALTYNQTITSFPTIAFISNKGYTPIPLFKASAEQKKDVNVQFY